MDKDLDKTFDKTKIQQKNIKEPYLFIGKPTKHVTSNLRKKTSDWAIKSSSVLSLFEQQKLRKKSAYLLAKTKILQKKSQKRLF